MKSFPFAVRCLAVIGLFFSVSLSLAPAYQGGFLNGVGVPRIRPSYAGTVERVSGNSLVLHQVTHGKHFHSFILTFTLTEQTAYLEGAYSNLARGAKIRVFCHLDPNNTDIVYADKVRFNSGS
jgi:hypothetical protein